MKSITVTLGDYFGLYLIDIQRIMFGFLVEGHIICIQPSSRVEVARLVKVGDAQTFDGIM